MKKPIVVLVLLLLFTVGGYLYMREGALPVNQTNETPVDFTIEKGESVTEIIDKLAREQLIRNKIVFLITLKRLGIDGSLQAGQFRLSQAMTASEIAKSLTVGISDIWITLVEGLRKEEIAHILTKDFSFPESEFVSEAEEGKIFPDTYLIPQDASAEAILSIIYSNFNEKYSDEIARKAERLGLSQKQVLTLASIVEKEAKTDEDRQQVASILLKRLNNDWPLQVDVSIQYALGYQPVENSWWKKSLTANDLKVRSPYNTYLNPGLPPGPIANPGISSIEAVVNADPTTPYWYYISNRDGTDMHFAQTDEEHQSNISKYLR